MNVAIVGAGGHGRVVLDILLQAAHSHSSCRGGTKLQAAAPAPENSGNSVGGSLVTPITSAFHREGATLGSAFIDDSRQADAIGDTSRDADVRALHVVAFIDSNSEIHGRRVDGLQVVGGLDDLPRLRDQLQIAGVIIAIGDNGIRRDYARRIDRMGLELISAIHPSASLAHNAHVGRNSVVAAGVVLCAHCQIGDSVILNTGCIIDHQTMIGEGVHICPGVRIAGRVRVEPGAFIGIGATILPKVNIGYEAIVGAGAVVTENVPDMTTVVGVPARAIKRAAADEETAAMLLPARM